LSGGGPNPYRPEIDGLRAVAVIPVVLYHAEMPGLPGGFTGVDIFFVISGYLITRIIAGELAAGTFSLARFYERRLRRIVPALAVVVAATLAAAWALALPHQFVETCESAVAALFSLSNFHFWRTSGYFSPAVEFMPLLHTWSLAVEEQFYLGLPLLLMALSARRRDAGRWLAAGLAVAFAAAVVVSYRWPSAAFYLLPARAWELGVGALLALGVVPAVRSRALAEALCALGLAAIAAGYLFVHAGMAFPGVAALLPVLGTALAIHAAPRADATTALLRARPLVAIGLVSYSLYLWHWPVLAFTRMAIADHVLPAPHAALAVAASLGLAALSWRFVETPFRGRRIGLPMLAGGLGTAVAALLAGATVGIVGHGFPQRLGDDARAALAARADIDPLREACEGLGDRPACTFGRTGGELDVVLLGDSHAAAMRGAVAGLPALADRRGTLWWRAGCAPLLGVEVVADTGPRGCDRFVRDAIDGLRRQRGVDLVVLAARWPGALLGTNPETGGSLRSHLVDDVDRERSAAASARVFARGLERTVRAIRALGVDVVLVGTVPEPGYDVPVVEALGLFNGVRSRPALPRAQVAARNREADAILAAVAARVPGTGVVRVWDGFCGERECVLSTVSGPAYSDDDHVAHSFASTTLRDLLQARWPTDPAPSSPADARTAGR
jgi:peptidoglycan/LPS O-acetylase OafA/YrhL